MDFLTQRRPLVFVKKAFFLTDSRHGQAKPEPVQTAVNKANDLRTQTLADIQKNPSKHQDFVNQHNKALVSDVGKRLWPGEFVDMLSEVQNPQMFGSKPLLAQKSMPKVPAWDPKSGKLPEVVKKETFDPGYNPRISSLVGEIPKPGEEFKAIGLKGLPVYPGQKDTPFLPFEGSSDQQLDDFNRSVVGAPRPTQLPVEASKVIGAAKPYSGTENPGENKPDNYPSWFQRYKWPLAGVGAAAGGFALYKYLLDDEKKKKIKQASDEFPLGESRPSSNSDIAYRSSLGIPPDLASAIKPSDINKIWNRTGPMYYNSDRVRPLNTELPANLPLVKVLTNPNAHPDNVVKSWLELGNNNGFYGISNPGGASGLGLDFPRDTYDFGTAHPTKADSTLFQNKAKSFSKQEPITPPKQEPITPPKQEPAAPAAPTNPVSENNWLQRNWKPLALGTGLAGVGYGLYRHLTDDDKKKK